MDLSYTSTQASFTQYQEIRMKKKLRKGLEILKEIDDLLVIKMGYSREFIKKLHTLLSVQEDEQHQQILKEIIVVEPCLENYSNQEAKQQKLDITSQRQKQENLSKPGNEPLEEKKSEEKEKEKNND